MLAQGAKLVTKKRPNRVRQLASGAVQSKKCKAMLRPRKISHLHKQKILKEVGNFTFSKSVCNFPGFYQVLGQYLFLLHKARLRQ